MADEQKANIEPESSTQDAPMPSAEQQTSEVVETAEVAKETSEAKPVEAADELTLPEDARERTTQQFEKLKRELAREKMERSKLERAFSSTQPQQPNSTLPEWYNPSTGEVDVQKLNQM